MRKIFQKVPIRRLQGESYLFGAFLFILSKELIIEILELKSFLKQKGGLP
jgi:hypothetical protein